MNDEGRITGGARPERRSEAEPVEESGRARAVHDRISVGGVDENVAKIQLATRWAELYAPAHGDTLEDALRRFRRAYHYVDSVTKLVEPDDA